ncbi:MAG: zinc-ribbon domain-containing protein [Lachnospiraceae bacterium]
MACTACSQPIAAGSKFCSSAAPSRKKKPAGGFCPNCGGKVEAGSKFCPNCGNKMA